MIAAQDKRAIDAREHDHQLNGQSPDSSYDAAPTYGATSAARHARRRNRLPAWPLVRTTDLPRGSLLVKIRVLLALGLLNRIEPPWRAANAVLWKLICCLIHLHTQVPLKGP